MADHGLDDWQDEDSEEVVFAGQPRTVDLGPPPEETSGRPGLGAAVAEHVGQGASFGFGDELAGAAGAALDYATGNAPRGFGQAYTDARDFARGRLKQEEADHPYASRAAELAGGLAGGVATGGVAGTAGRAATVGGRIAQGATLGAGAGAATGLGKSEADTLAGALPEIERGAVVGGLTGAALTGAGEAIGAGLRSARAYLGRLAENRAVKALDITPAEVERMGGPAAARPVGREALDKGVISPFASAEDMLARAQQVKGQAGEDLAFLRASNQAEVPSATLVRSLEQKLTPPAAGLSNDAARAAQLQALANDIEAFGNGTGKLDMTQLAQLKKYMSSPLEESTAFTSPGALSAAKARTDAARQIAMEAENDLARHLSPEDAAAFFAKKRTYGAMDDAVTGLTGRAAREMGGGPSQFGMRDMIAGTIGQTVGGPAGAAAGVALNQAGKVLSPQVTAVLADQFGKAAGRVLASPWGNVLAEAARTGGPNAVAVYDNILRKQVPEFRQVLEQDSGEDWRDEQPVEVTAHEETDPSAEVASAPPGAGAAAPPRSNAAGPVGRAGPIGAWSGDPEEELDIAGTPAMDKLVLDHFRANPQKKFDVRERGWMMQQNLVGPEEAENALTEQIDGQKSKTDFRWLPSRDRVNAMVHTHPNEHGNRKLNDMNRHASDGDRAALKAARVPSYVMGTDGVVRVLERIGGKIIEREVGRPDVGGE